LLRFDPAKFKASYYPSQTIRQTADDFRNTYWHSEELPIDIAGIVELDLKLEIRPVDRLKEFLDIDALLFGNMKGITVDKQDFMNDKAQNRLRFSLAHEIGHYVLHRDVYNNFPYDDPDGWIELTQQIPKEEYDWIEYHANEFAGRLLVARDFLEKDLKKAVKHAESTGFSKWNALDKDRKEFAKEYIASAICKKYGVSQQVIMRRLDREELWPPH